MVALEITAGQETLAAAECMTNGILSGRWEAKLPGDYPHLRKPAVGAHGRRTAPPRRGAPSMAFGASLCTITPKRVPVIFLVIGALPWLISLFWALCHLLLLPVPAGGRSADHAPVNLPERPSRRESIYRPRALCGGLFAGPPSSTPDSFFYALRPRRGTLGRPRSGELAGEALKARLQSPAPVVPKS